MDQDFTVSPTPGGEWDFNPQFPTAALPAPPDFPKRSKTIPEEKVDPRKIDILDFMDMIQHSPDMVTFAEPFSQTLNWVRDRAFLLKDLPNYDRCDQRFLPHLAGNFGFELIDIPYATERERRKMIRDIIPILKRRGTLWSIRRIIENLGFTVSFEETYQVSGIWNRHKFWDPSAIASSERVFDWNDGTMQGWLNESGGDFKAIAQQLRGKAQTGAPLEPSAGATIADTNNDYSLSFDFRLLTTGDCWFGAIVRWESATKSLLVTLDKTGANELLRLYLYNGTWLSAMSADIAATSWRTGTHRLTIWDTGSKLTIILDDTTFFYEIDYAASVATNKKGLFVAPGTDVEFDNYKLRIINRSKQPKFIAAGQFDKTLTITLGGTPLFEDAKREYLQKIMGEFVSIGVVIQWI